MKKIALTGSIATGKSTIALILKEKGLPIIDCDEIVSYLYQDEVVKKLLFKAFGTSNKQMLAKTVFKQSEKRKQLEELLHPLVFEKIKIQLKEFEVQGEKIVIVDIPLLFEGEFQDFFDEIIVVSATREQQFSRLLERGLTKRDAEERINSQLPIEAKLKQANYVIDTSNGLLKAKTQADFLAKKLFNSVK